MIHRLLIALLSFPLASSCATINAKVDGVVFESATGKPIAEAFVIAQWIRHGADPVGSRTTCPHVEIVQTDVNGRFRIPEASVPGPGLERDVFAYKQGYSVDYSAPYSETRIALKPYDGDAESRANSFRTYASLISCGPYERLIVLLPPLFSELDNEDRQLKGLNRAKVPEWQFEKRLRNMREGLERDRRKELERSGVKVQ